MHLFLHFSYIQKKKADLGDLSKSRLTWVSLGQSFVRSFVRACVRARARVCSCGCGCVGGGEDYVLHESKQLTPFIQLLAIVVLVGAPRGRHDHDRSHRLLAGLPLLPVGTFFATHTVDTTILLLPTQAHFSYSGGFLQMLSTCTRRQSQELSTSQSTTCSRAQKSTRIRRIAAACTSSCSQVHPVHFIRATYGHAHMNTVFPAFFYHLCIVSIQPTLICLPEDPSPHACPDHSCQCEPTKSSDLETCGLFDAHTTQPCVCKVQSYYYTYQAQ